jgi:hypothetical protein
VRPDDSTSVYECDKQVERSLRTSECGRQTYKDFAFSGVKGGGLIWALSPKHLNALKRGIAWNSTLWINQPGERVLRAVLYEFAHF